MTTPAVAFRRFATVLLQWAACAIASAEADDSPGLNLKRGLFSSAVFSADGCSLLTASGDIAQLWDVETGKLIRQFAGHQASIHSVCFSPDHRRILTGAGNAGVVGPDDHTARLFDVATGKQLSVFEGLLKFIFSAQFSPDGKQILTVAFDVTLAFGNTATLWDADTATKQFSLSGVTYHSATTGKIELVRFSPQGDTLVGLLRSNTQINLWDAKTGEVVRQFSVARHDFEQEETGFGSIEFSPDGKLLLAASSDQRARIWDVGTGREVQVLDHASDINAASFCFHGAKVMTASKDGIARLWDTHTGREEKRFQHPDPILSMELSPDSKRMIIHWRKLNENPLAPPALVFASLWNVESGQEIRRFDKASGLANCSMTFSPDNQKILANVMSERAVLLDARTGETIRTY